MSKIHKAVVTVGPRQLLQLIDVPTPTPKANELLVRVDWTASTPLDLHQADGGLLVEPPQVLGDSCAGPVVAVGPHVKNFVVGDKVFGFTWRSQQEKAHQEYLVAPENLFGKIPDGFREQDVVTIPNNFVTAFQSSKRDLGLELPWPKPDGWMPRDAEKPILVWGGSSSVGQYAIQILSYFGYKKIIATASKKHHEFLQSLGATAVADYRDADAIDQVRKLAGGNVPYVIDCIGSLEGSVRPISKLAEDGTTVAIMLPVITKDGSETEMPEYEMDVEKVVPWNEGVKAKGVRTHFYLQVSRSWDHIRDLANWPRMIFSQSICNPRSCQLC
jgi:NADPH:quinone reductase-like Zn-dependent oxidoreductase